MSKVYFSAVVIIPPEDKWKAIQEIREKYDYHFYRWMPHITLLYPFRPENEYHSLEKKFLEKCKSIDPFTIHFKQFNYFEHGKQKFTLWICPEPIELIKNIQTSILEIVPDCNDVNKYKKGFTPHLSIGQIQGKKKLEETLKILQKKWSPIHFFLNQIYFISREKSKTSKFEIKKQIYLKKE